MQNTLWKKDDDILRVLECHDDEVLVIDCKKLTMPTWKGIVAFSSVGDFHNQNLFIESALSRGKAIIMSKSPTVKMGLKEFIEGI